MSCKKTIQLVLLTWFYTTPLASEPGILNVGFDIDDTVLFSRDVFLNIPLNKRNPLDYGWVNKQDERMSLFIEPTVELINYFINNGHNIYFITARSGENGKFLAKLLTKNFNIKIYRLCTGAKGWSKKEQTKMWKAHEKLGKLAIELKDKDGTPLINKQKQNQRRRVIKKKVDSFIEEGFENIILAGHSSGGWQSIKIKAEFPELAKGVIGLHPGAGGTVKNRKDWPWWEDVRYYGFVEDLSKLNAFIITHDKDEYNSPKDYSLFSNLNSVKFLNLTQSGCKKAEPSKTYHGIALTKCYGDYETKNKNIIEYLEGIF